MKDFVKEIENLSGSLLIIGKINFKVLPEPTNIMEVFYLNSDTYINSNDETNCKNIASDIHLREIHKYFKDGIDNIYCNYEEIKDHFPSFFRESLRITKSNIYLVFKNKTDYKKIEKKYKRYNIECEYVSTDEYNVLIVKANDIMVSPFKETYYYIIDSLEKTYNYVIENV